MGRDCAIRLKENQAYIHDRSQFSRFQKTEVAGTIENNVIQQRNPHDHSSGLELPGRFAVGQDEYDFHISVRPPAKDVWGGEKHGRNNDQCLFSDQCY
jgi:hypothetical protein